jgi:iron complex transport system substrate-binding protein
VLASHLHISKIVPALEQLGITVVVTNPGDIPSVLHTIELLGKLLKVEKKERILTGQMRDQISHIEGKIKGKKKIRVFWELSCDLWTAGKGSFIDDLISRAGGENIAAAIDAPWLQLSGEYIIDADPEVIFLADHPFGISKEETVSRPGWEIISAVKNKRVIEITAGQTDLISRPGPRVVQALTFIAKILHPDCFTERSSKDS